MLLAKEQFRFYTRLHLSELTGLRASTLDQLLKLLKQVPGSSIYYHTHRFLQQHQYLSPEPPNDFAYWVSEMVGEDELAEQLASIDTVQFRNIRSLRDEIVRTVEAYLRSKPLAKLRFSSIGEEFHFVKAVSFVIPTNNVANNLAEFLQIIKRITIDSIYYHVFEARLRLEQETNDFSNWIATALGDTALADEISRLDPYTRTLEDLRNSLIAIIDKRMGERRE
ncbi:MAG: DUF5752 family protein [Candidatus Omnitrophica bacterium]|nr:DUF5752 family protein [Candidatus Omnitrophota bacterium]MDD5079370.1 DUF5752 family protein [Candidatus Omnitrophota bacterium]